MKGQNEKFVPKGVLAFFIGMLALYALMWLSIYALLVIYMGG